MGQEFSILSDKGDEYVEGVVQYINERVREIKDISKDATTLNIAILATLNIADDLFKTREEKNVLCGQVKSRTEKLIDFIEQKKRDADL
jgi:cell division protein ZapA